MAAVHRHPRQVHLILYLTHHQVNMGTPRQRMGLEASLGLEAAEAGLAPEVEGHRRPTTAAQGDLLRRPEQRLLQQAHTACTRLIHRGRCATPMAMARSLLLNSSRPSTMVVSALGNAPTVRQQVVPVPSPAAAVKRRLSVLGFQASILVHHPEAARPGAARPHPEAAARPAAARPAAPHQAAGARAEEACSLRWALHVRLAREEGYGCWPATTPLGLHGHLCQRPGQAGACSQAHCLVAGSRLYRWPSPQVPGQFWR